MIVVYDTVYETPMDALSRTGLYVGRAQGVVVSLRSHDFDIRYVNGVAGVELSRPLSNDEARALGAALIKAAGDNERLELKVPEIVQYGC